MKVLFGVTCK